MKRLGNPPFICLITDGSINKDNYDSQRLELIRTIRDAVTDGVNIVQVRERELPARLLFDLTKEIVESVRDLDSVVLVNDRADVALAAGADGVHLRESSLSPAIVRASFPSEVIVGVSTHSFQGAQSAATLDSDFIFFGPVFESPGKGDPTGTTELRKVCRAVEGVPVIALGGINGENAGQAFDAGARGVAGIRSMYDRADRRLVVRAISAHAPRLR